MTSTLPEILQISRAMTNSMVIDRDQVGAR